MSDFLVRGSLKEIDPVVDELIKLETERQRNKLILIPSESTAPSAVRDALSSTFQNIYAEGYPDEETRWMTEDEILNYPDRLANYRRFADPRYYKGVEYADVVESLARRRCAEAFATPEISADKIFVNVQPLSGAPANNAVYTALINPGDAILGMNLLHGGHLSHGSSVNRSGKLFSVSHYNVNPETEQIDYDAIAAIAMDKKPKIIIAGYSSYPWVPDWKIFRSIADSVGAYLLADISHIAGMVSAGVIASPIGHAHIITFTTHKTLCGPRGACILTLDPLLSKKIDRAVFPGEQGGPHVNVFAALSLTFKLACTPQFKLMQQQIIKNSLTLTNRLKERGFRIPFGGTNTHLGNLDCKTIVGPDGTKLMGDFAVRILDIAGLVLNRNTIPGDTSAMKASGLRFGTPWVTQRGLKEPEMVKIGDILADVLNACQPYKVDTHTGIVNRAKVNFDVLEYAKIRTRILAQSSGFDGPENRYGYPHFYYLDDKPTSKNETVQFDLKGENIHQFVNYAFSSDIDGLTTGTSQNTKLWTENGIIDGVITFFDKNHFKFTVISDKAALSAAWLRDLSDSYIHFDQDITRRLPGPITVTISGENSNYVANNGPSSEFKPFYIGIHDEEGPSLPEFNWVEPKVKPLRRTPLYETHIKSGAKMVPFAGWEMPVWYSSVLEEHLATRKNAGIFDVSHMGVYQAEGPQAAAFLDSVCSNDISVLKIGNSCYTHFLDPDANVIDDTLIYRRASQKYLVVVNASNDDKDWAWLNAIRNGKILIDKNRPWTRSFGRKVILRNLRDQKEGQDMRLDIAIQGKRSRDIILALGCDPDMSDKIKKLGRTQLCEGNVGGYDLIISRTGYTGEKMAFELFVHPDHVVALWDSLIKVGDGNGLKPCGLGARDSLRTEAGLPLYGQEMGGTNNLGVAEAGFGSYVKIHKPWFIGREAYIARENARKGVVVRFRFTEKAVRMAHPGDPVLDQKGRMIGYVTSCAIDSEGFLTGLAFLDKSSSVEGTNIAIFQGASKLGNIPAAELKHGEKIVLPCPAVVLSRFPKLN